MTAPGPAFTVAVPTDGASPHLRALLAVAAEEGARLLPVWTSAAPVPPALQQMSLDSGGAVIVDRGPANISRWWRTAIITAAASTPDPVIIINDDASWTPGDPSALVRALISSGAAIAAPVSKVAYREVVGWCFAIDPSRGLLPDLRFVWFYGDDDLFQRAAALGGVHYVPLPGVLHHKFRRTEFGAMRRQCRADEDLWLRLQQERGHGHGHGHEGGGPGAAG